MKQLNQIKTEQIQGKSIKKSQCLWGDDFINSFVTKVVFISHFWRFFVVFSSYESDCLCNQIIFFDVFSLHFLRSLTRQEDDIKSIILLDKYGNSRWIRLLIKVSFAWFIINKSIHLGLISTFFLFEYSWVDISWVKWDIKSFLCFIRESSSSFSRSSNSSPSFFVIKFKFLTHITGYFRWIQMSHQSRVQDILDQVTTFIQKFLH